MTVTGKHLTDLEYEVMVLRKFVRTIFDNEACITWASDGTLAYFDYVDGNPQDYWLEGHPYPHNNRDEYTDLRRFIARLKTYTTDPYELHLLSSPVWCVCEPVEPEKKERPHHLRLVK